METCVVLGARSYSFEDAQGKLVSGVSVTYITGDVENEADRKGAFPLTITGPLQLLAQFPTLPGVYDMDFKQRPGPKGKPTLQVVGATLKGPLDGFLRVAKSVS